MFNKMTLAVKAYGDARLPVDLLPEVSEESLSHLRTRMFGEVSDNVVVR
jgi:hypothetical protein